MVFRDYRGKSRNGHWVYGSLMFNDGFCTIFTNKNLSTDVILNTVGQWSGIYDINNTKVYEGDIIKDCKHLYSVEFNAPWANFSISWYANIFYLLSLKENMEVIGNIYDGWMSN